MEDIEGMERLFFDLASESRLGILKVLKDENLKMHEITRRLDLTSTEVFRQLERLCAALLVQKQPEGTYTISNYGRLILQLFPAFGFAFKHKKYFLEQDIWKLPYQFISRLGELSEGLLTTGITEIMNKIEEMIKSSEEHVWVITNQVLTAHSRAMTRKLPEGIKFRSLIHESLLGSSQIQVPTEKNVERRVLSDIPAIVLITEKEAFFGLFKLSGETSNSGFFGSNPLFMNWVNELFSHYWVQGKSWFPKST